MALKAAGPQENQIGKAVHESQLNILGIFYIKCKDGGMIPSKLHNDDDKRQKDKGKDVSEQEQPWKQERLFSTK